METKIRVSEARISRTITIPIMVTKTVTIRVIGVKGGKAVNRGT